MKKDNLYISTDKSLLDINLIYHYLSLESYWAKGRSKETIEKSIQHSLCFGIYDNTNKQLGFARVVSDYAVFAWLMDVFVLDDYQGKGLGKQLINAVVNHQDLQGLKRWGLGTKDAHSLYEKFGFQSLSEPDKMMERLPFS
ncbi:GNAT family N-acetyltransferase [Olivibacter domesticus]|uniref:Acetyltransferase (GNAT) family protein n=1 Tax=Olivibacter domesticus TaxID=407022 RepID=A0A1H7J8Q1_OLID1|nr:GNAT family N-acetyltransferase [Olivibacter domesticus]SEK71071.1 Acetyltransferase (GNAT) family protein [Olivibacter domesticus]